MVLWSGWHSAQILFNLYINATLKELSSESNGSYPYAYQIFLGLESQDKEARAELCIAWLQKIKDHPETKIADPHLRSWSFDDIVLLVSKPRSKPPAWWTEVCIDPIQIPRLLQFTSLTVRARKGSSLSLRNHSTTVTPETCRPFTPTRKVGIRITTSTGVLFPSFLELPRMLVFPLWYGSRGDVLRSFAWGQNLCIWRQHVRNEQLQKSSKIWIVPNFQKFRGASLLNYSYIVLKLLKLCNQQKESSPRSIISNFSLKELSDSSYGDVTRKCSWVIYLWYLWYRSDCKYVSTIVRCGYFTFRNVYSIGANILDQVLLSSTPISRFAFIII